MTLEDIYRDVMRRDPAMKNCIDLVCYVTLLALFFFLLRLIVEGYSEGFLGDTPTGMYILMTSLLWFAVALMVVCIFIITIVIRRHRIGNIQYDISGNILYDIRYDPKDTLRIHPYIKYGGATLIIGYMVLFGILNRISFPLSVLSILILCIVFPSVNVTITIFFAKVHYVITDEGIGYISVGLCPHQTFYPWDAFEGYSTKGHTILLYPTEKGSKLGLGIKFPWRIPVRNNLESVCILMGHYIPER